MDTAVITAEELCAYLGVDEENGAEVARLRAAAIERICRASGIDWTARTDVELFNEAVRTQVWLSYYAVRDTVKNTQFLQEYLTGLICSLQLCRKAGTE